MKITGGNGLDRGRNTAGGSVRPENVDAWAARSTDGPGAAKAAPAETVQKRPVPLPVNNALHKLLAALKLPPDNLSRSIIAFARFFSLPLEPKQLASFRRQALGFPLSSPSGEERAGGTSIARAGSGRTSRGEAAALAAAAAADKGVALTEKALADYAAAIDPATGNDMEERPWRVPDRERSGQDGDGGYRGNGESPGKRHSGSEGFAGGGQGGETGGGNNHDKIGPEPEDLRRRVLAALEKNPFLDLINRIPGKNGRWMVLPFGFCEGSLVFDAVLRIFVPGNPSAPERLTMDLTVTRPGEPFPKRWIITLERPGTPANAPCTSARLSVFSGNALREPCPAEKKRWKKTLAQILRIAPEQVSPEQVSIGEKTPFFADTRNEHLQTVDEAV